MSKIIIWIDDDTDIIDPVVRPLELAGHDIRRFHTVAEALAGVEEAREADLILLDMILPPGTGGPDFGRYPGKQILSEFRETYGIETPVVALTVVARDEVLRGLKELGVADIVRKPVRPSELKRRVEDVFSGSE